MIGRGGEPDDRNHAHELTISMRVPLDAGTVRRRHKFEEIFHPIAKPAESGVIVRLALQ